MLMLPVSIMGLVFNLIQMKLLHQEEPETLQSDSVKNINVESAYLHVLGDMLMSCGVILAATVIYFNPSLWWFDPMCTFLFAIIVLTTSYPVLSNCLIVMMEGTPDSIDTDELAADIKKLADVVGIDDLHVW